MSEYRPGQQVQFKEECCQDEHGRLCTCWSESYIEDIREDGALVMRCRSASSVGWGCVRQPRDVIKKF